MTAMEKMVQLQVSQRPTACATVLPVDAPVHIHKCLHKSDDLMPLVNLV